jgi:hypothetical protein
VAARAGPWVCLTELRRCLLPYPDRTPVVAPGYGITSGNRQIDGTTAASGHRGHVNPFNRPQSVPVDIT